LSVFALLLQGGVYQALSEAHLGPDWLAGMSIGALNAALIAGNRPRARVGTLRGFWQQPMGGSPWGSSAPLGVAPCPARDDVARGLVNQLNPGAAPIGGVPGFFVPHIPAPGCNRRICQGVVLITVLEILAFTAAGSTANAALPAVCDMRLSVELTPDVPNPRDEGFLSSLLSNHAGYQLTLRRERNGSVIVLDLTGPGPDCSCRNVIETMRRDARVRSVDVQREI
jgi:hypothetical protein